MLRIIQQASAAAAKAYYQAADYYTEGQELAGVWHGRGAERLGLNGEIDKAAFDALCENRSPESGAPLTPRTKQERRVGYDINFHAPKSVSLLYGLTNDPDILDAFQAAVGDTMQELEADARTRVRRAGQQGERVTGNLTWAEFTHTTARPVDGVPDPHLHAHCFVFNATFDSAEQRWKAVDVAAIKRDAPYFEAAFHARLAHNLSERGFGIARNNGGWEIDGVPTRLRDTFSRRTAQIERHAAAKGITDARALDALGARTREAKRPDLSPEALRTTWQNRLADADRQAMQRIAEKPVQLTLAGDDPHRRAMAYAVDHCFTHDSVVPERTLLATALRRGAGEVTVDGMRRELEGHGLLFQQQGDTRLATTREVLAEEQRMLAFARSGRGRSKSLSPGTRYLARPWLNDGQQAAVRHVLHSPDRVMLIRGAAGTGKTSLMQEAVEAIEAGGKRVITLAPSADASRGTLRQEGFSQADTVARFLTNEQFQAQAKGQVLWIDEAGQLGTRNMAKLFGVAERLDARVILSGDQRQHGAVERGAALRLLEKEAGLVPAEVTAIQRQKGAYKRAVLALSEGEVGKGFDQLERLGWVVELPGGEREKCLASDYAAAQAAGKSTLIVSPTHAEGRQITAAVRAELRQRGQLKGEEHQLNRLELTQRTPAERSDPARYQAGDVVEFDRAAKGFRRGERCTVTAATPEQVTVHDQTGRERALPLTQSERFQLYRQQPLPLTPGDRVRITKNGTTADQAHRLNNGASYTVREVAPDGNITLDNGWVIGREFGHLTHGYCVTSHAAQGKTVDRVFVAQASTSFPATSREQFYVSASRARERLTVYTDDAAALRQSVQRSKPSSSAVEVMKAAPQHRWAAHMGQVQRLAYLGRAYAARALAAGKERFLTHQQPELEMER